MSSLTTEKIHNLYWNDELSYRDIAKLDHVSDHVMLYRFRKEEIPFRSRSEASKISAIRHPRPWKENFWQYSGLLHPMLGKHRSPETKAKLSEKKSKTVRIEISESFAYLLGIIYGDGNVGNQHNGIRVFVGQNESFAETCLSLFRSIGLNPKKYIEKHAPPRKPSIIVRTYSIRLTKWLCNNLQVSCLKGELKTSLHLKRFWQGLYRAEGYFNKRGQIQISNTDMELMKWGKQALENLGYHPTLRKIVHPTHPKWKPLYNVYLSRKAEAMSFLSDIPELK